MIFKKIIQTLFYSKKIEIQLNYSLEEFIKRLSSLPDNKYVILHSEETNDVLSFKIQKKLFLERDFFNPIVTCITKTDNDTVYLYMKTSHFNSTFPTFLCFGVFVFIYSFILWVFAHELLFFSIAFLLCFLALFAVLNIYESKKSDVLIKNLIEYFILGCN